MRHDGNPCAAGYTGMISERKSSTVDRPSALSSISSYSGFASCSVRRKTLTLPANNPDRPGRSSRSRHAWLPKKAQDIRRCPSVIVTSRIEPRRAFIGRLRTSSTRARTVTCSPISSPAMSVSSPRRA